MLTIIRIMSNMVAGTLPYLSTKIDSVTAAIAKTTYQHFSDTDTDTRNITTAMDIQLGTTTMATLNATMAMKNPQI